MSNWIQVTLRQTPNKEVVNVLYSITDIESTHDTPGIYSVEIESIYCEGDILSLLAWYTYDSLINEVIEYIKELEDED